MKCRHCGHPADDHQRHEGDASAFWECDGSDTCLCAELVETE